MTIGIERYIRITSGVGGAAALAARDLIGRLFTTNVRVPVDEVLEFLDADAVLSFFGPGEEARRAAFYFGFISKTLSRPKRLGFARLAMTAEPPRIFGARAASLANLRLIADGTLTIVSGEDTAALTDLDFSAATNYADIATVIQTALRAVAAAPAFATATVSYQATNGAFNLVTSVAGPGSISASGSASASLGWADGATLSPGAAAQTVTEAVASAADVSTNFGSFAFVPTLTEEQSLEAAEWANSRNVEFFASLRVSPDNAASLSAATESLGGVSLTLAPDPLQYDEMLPMALAAATNYDRRGAAQSYMYQQAALNPKVTSDADADRYDGLRVNFYGQTQTSGQRLAFYQRGVLQGPLTLPRDTNTFVNEMWLKDAARAALMNLMLSAPRVPATDEGRAMVLSNLQGPISRALTNGTISIGKPLSDAQKSFIGTITNSPDAWRQVQTIGYWVDAVVVPVGADYRIDYVLVYSKDDAIRQIDGVHSLI